jgi:pyrroline-5-carboxylate reductase
MKIVFIGSGNVATHLAMAAKKAGHHILQIYSHSAENARCLAKKVNAKCTNRLSEINCFAEIYIFSIKDDVLGEVLSEMPATEGLWIHTAGSIPMNFSILITIGMAFYIRCRHSAKARNRFREDTTLYRSQ